MSVEGKGREERYRRLVEAIRQCRKCPLHASRKNPVPGEGPLEANVMIVGEAPGRREDETGRPFVGPAGRLLDALLASIGVDRRSVYITNIVKCRPPGNRDPTPSEIKACLPYLIEQISIIQPRIIIALGRHAGRTIFGLLGRPWRGMAAEHGVIVHGRIRAIDLDLTVVATYHPAAALYNPNIRRILEEDFKGPIKTVIEEIQSGKHRGRRGLLDYM